MYGVFLSPLYVIAKRLAIAALGVFGLGLFVGRLFRRG